MELALHNLKAANVLDLPRLQELSLEALAHLIRPSGFFNIKIRRLKSFVHHFSNHCDNDLAAFLNQTSLREFERRLAIEYHRSRFPAQMGPLVIIYGIGFGVALGIWNLRKYRGGTNFDDA